MAGVGPPPARSDQRRRTNAPPIPVESAKSGDVVVPDPGGSWPTAVRQVWDGLLSSGQRVYYQSSDWAVAWLALDLLAIELARKPAARPQMLGEIRFLLSGLLLTEGDRRRVRIEIERAPSGPAPVAGLALVESIRGRISS